MMICGHALLLFQHNAQMLLACNYYAQHNRLKPSGTFPGKQQVSVLQITKMHHRTTERLTSDSLGNVSWTKKIALQKECATPPHFQVRHCM